MSDGSDLEREFPSLKQSPYGITSPATIEYNCFAWAAEDSERWWEPDPFGEYFWPARVPRVMTVQAFVHAFSTIGYKACDSADLEDGHEKVAIYVDQEGVPSHMARQLHDGRWTSKLGRLEDIEHNLGDPAEYGTVVRILKRHRPSLR